MEQYASGLPGVARNRARRVQVSVACGAAGFAFPRRQILIHVDFFLERIDDAHHDRIEKYRLGQVISFDHHDADLTAPSGADWVALASLDLWIPYGTGADA